MSSRQCLICGMTVSLGFTFPDMFTEANLGSMGEYCPKCDSNLLTQSDGSCLTQDIAHQHESVTVALSKLTALLSEAYAGYYSCLRLIVGGGLIKEEVLAQLEYYKRESNIISYIIEQHNRGVILVVIREPISD